MTYVIEERTYKKLSKENYINANRMNKKIQKTGDVHILKGLVCAIVFFIMGILFFFLSINTKRASSKKQ